MSINWTFGRKLSLGFAIAVLALAVTGISGYRSTAHLVENDRLVSHTHEVRASLSDLLSLLKDAETAPRGLVIPGEGSSLEPYRGALPQITKTLSDIRSLTADNDAQQRRLSALQPLVGLKLEDMQRYIEMRRAEGLEATARVVARGA